MYAIYGNIYHQQKKTNVSMNLPNMDRSWEMGIDDDWYFADLGMFLIRSASWDVYRELLGRIMMDLTNEEWMNLAPVQGDPLDKFPVCWQLQ